MVNPIHDSSGLNETFTAADFLYGPRTARPGPGTGYVPPFHSGQKTNDPSTAEALMFVDLYVGDNNDRCSIDSGDAQVQYDISGLHDDTVAFNAYAWAFSAEIADSSINWTNNVSTNPAAPGQSGLSITTSAVPEPASLALFATGLAASRRRPRR